MNSVDLGNKLPTPPQLERITQLQNALFSAQNKFFSVSTDAYSKYIADKRAQTAKQTFAAWCAATYPTYNAFKYQLLSANAALQQYSIQVYGPAFTTLSGQRTKLETRAHNEVGLEAG